MKHDMMIKNLRYMLDTITGIPRPHRSVVSDILKECYKQGKEWKRKEYKRVAKIKESAIIK